MIKKGTVNELPIPYIYVEGSSRERGLQHGKQCAGLIKKSIDAYKFMSQVGRGGASWEKIETDIKRFIDPLKKYDQELFEEMEGIAEGAGVPLEEILLLNVSAEVINSVWDKASTVSEGCTSFIVMPKKTKGHKIFMAQTYDWIYMVKDCVILLHSNNLEQTQFITVTKAGMVGKIGCNNHGVGVILNYLFASEINPKGTPYHILLRRALDSKDIIDAQRNLLRAPIAFGLNIMLADGDANAIGYEFTAVGCDFYREKNGYLLHTNHYLSDKMVVKDFFPHLIPNSKARYNYANSYLAEAKNIKVEDVISLLSAHIDEKDSICRHWRGKIEEAATLFSIIMEMSEMKMYISLGTPCSSDFYELELKQIFR